MRYVYAIMASGYSGPDFVAKTEEEAVAWLDNKEKELKKKGRETIRNNSLWMETRGGSTYERYRVYRCPASETLFTKES